MGDCFFRPIRFGSTGDASGDVMGLEFGENLTVFGLLTFRFCFVFSSKAEYSFAGMEILRTFLSAGSVTITSVFAETVFGSLIFCSLCSPAFLVLSSASPQ